MAMQKRNLGALAPEQRPREKLLGVGARELDAGELLAVVLGTGRGSGEDALQLADRVITELGGPARLVGATASELMQLRGVGPTRAARIRAAVELGLRPWAAGEPVGPPTDHVARLKGQVAPGATAVLGYRPLAEEPPVTLSAGEGLGAQSRIGSYLAQLLTEGAGPWWVVLLRPGDAPLDEERDVAARLLDGAEMVGLGLERVVALVGGQLHVLGEPA
jgi:hypothetical protein